MRKRILSVPEPPRPIRGSRLIAIRTMICALTAASAIFGPPASGAILVLPITPAAAWDDGTHMAPHMTAMGILAIAAAPAGRGDAR